MKKLAVIILVVVLMFSVFAFAGCDIEGNGNPNYTIEELLRRIEELEARLAEERNELNKRNEELEAEVLAQFFRIAELERELDVETQLNPMVERIMRRDYWLYLEDVDLDIDRIDIGRHWVFSFGVAAIIDIEGMWSLPTIGTRMIGEVSFRVQGMRLRLFVWHDRAIYTLQEVYNKGLITQSDLIMFADWYNPLHFNREHNSEWFR